jgi:hypothetical protein
VISSCSQIPSGSGNQEARARETWSTWGELFESDLKLFTENFHISWPKTGKGCYKKPIEHRHTLTHSSILGSHCSKLNSRKSVWWESRGNEMHDPRVISDHT